MGLRAVYGSLSAEQRLAVDLVFLELTGIRLATFLAAERFEDFGPEDLDRVPPEYCVTFTAHSGPPK